MLRRFFIGFPILVGLVIGAASLFGIHLNYSASYPVGLWIEVEGEVSMALDRHPYVLVCAPGPDQRARYVQQGYLKWGFACNGSVPLLKRVWASVGDYWSVTADGVRVNNRLIANTKPLEKDSKGRPMPKAAGGMVPDGHVLLLSDHSPLSFDGRYFGSTPVEDLISEVRPLWTASP
ncbi:MAG: conjugative transfer signal peptidase TraF [Sedimenticola sp.]